VRENDTEHPLFHGCWDWHSAVHGHWALLENAIRLEEAEDIEWVVQRLESESMNLEFAFLTDHPLFEMPYGRAWLLRLILSYRSITGKTLLDGKTQGVAKHLREWLGNTSLDPGTTEYLNPTWALIQLGAWSNALKDTETQAWVRERTQACFEGQTTSLHTDREGRGEFFSCWANQALLILNTLGEDALAKWVRNQTFHPLDLQVVKKATTAHHLAINASRAWGFQAVYQATRDDRWKHAYETHLTASFALHEQWKSDRRAYAHWVPQFTLYACYQSVGR
jgi:hypothetical protein